MSPGKCRAAFIGPLVATIALGLSAAHGAVPALQGRLVYSSDRGPNVRNVELYSLSVAGTRVLDLSQNQGFDGNASVSPDGRWIAFRSERLAAGRVGHGLFIMRPDGSGKRRLTPPGLAAGGEAHATWSPDSRALVFFGFDGTRAGVWFVRVDGTGLRLLAENARDPEWEPRGTRLAVARASSLGPQVETIDVGTGARTLLGPGFSPTWSPDARSIAFVRADDSRGSLDTFDLFVVPADGGVPTRLTRVDPVTRVEQPTWSPTGKLIAFTHASAVNTIRPDGSQMRRLRVGENPSWSPNGTRIAFLFRRGVHVMRADGSRSRQIRVPGLGFVFFDVPEWTRDGKRLIVDSMVEQSQYDLFVSNADGSRLRRLMRTKQNERLPAWSPDRRRIAFVRNERAPQIWLVSSTGRGPRRLRAGTYPSWAPGGKRLAFERGGGVYTMNDRGTGVKTFGVGSKPSWSPSGLYLAVLRGETLVLINTRDRRRRALAYLGCGGGDLPEAVLQQPEWSPDGRTLGVTWLCDLGRSATSGVWLVDVKTGAKRAFPPGGAALTRVAWSPNGRWIAFATPFVFDRLSAAQVDGSNPRHISTSAGDDRDLDWR